MEERNRLKKTEKQKNISSDESNITITIIQSHKSCV